MFKGPGVRGVIMHARQDPQGAPPDLNATLVAWASAVWTNARDVQTGLFRPEWLPGQVDPAPGDIGSTIAAAMALNLIADFVCPLPAGPQAALRLEAEEAVVSHALLENAHGPFSGWGYVAGFGFVTQRLTFLVPVQPGGASFSAVRIRYSSLTPEPRHVVLNGVALTSKPVVFNATGSWDVWQTATLPLPSIPPPWTLALQPPTDGSYVNIDYIELAYNE